MYDKVTQFFCNHNWKKLKNGSYKCSKCDKEKPKTIPNIRQTNNYKNNMLTIKRNIEHEKKAKLK